ncbi:MAG: hypothetical protein IJ283_04620 [Oscillospiraceae bacterium]|nr:hypothetical protein [Oscillospiraceae bacterium]
MNKTVSALMSGAAAAAAVGTAVYMMNGTKRNSVRKVRKSAAKTVKAVGNIANGISSIMR